jgi:hypothetical protein
MKASVEPPQAKFHCSLLRGHFTRRIKHPFDVTIQHARSAAMIAGVDRFAQPLQSKLDIVTLQMAPALDLGLVSILRVTLEVSGSRWRFAILQDPARLRQACNVVAGISKR